MASPEPVRPHFGFTRTGQPVHRRAADHLPAHNRAARCNKWLALKVTGGVGTMWCAYVFGVVALKKLIRGV